MITSRDDLIRFIEDKATAKWEDDKLPYMISSIATDLVPDDVDYKSIISPLRLKQFLETEHFQRVKIVNHPLHRAAVAIVPKDAPFSFPDQSTIEPSAAPPEASRRKRSRAVGLLEALSELSAEDLNRILIPVDLLVKLHNS